MSQSEARSTADSASGVEFLDAVKLKQAKPAEPGGFVPPAVPIAKSLKSERRLPSVEPPNPLIFSAKVRQRWRGSSQLSPQLESESKVGIELRERPPFHFRDLFTSRFLRKNLGFLISFWVHLLLFVLLSLVVVSAGIGDSPLFLDATSAPDSADEASLEMADLDADLEISVEPETNDLEELFEEQVAIEESLKNAVSSIDDIKTKDPAASAGASGGGQQRGDGKSATFFGTRAAGRRFVFVVDRSLSMRGGSGRGGFLRGFRRAADQPFNRFDVATSELFAAISSLQPHQEFFVFMFAHDTIPMFGQQSIERSEATNFKTVSATPENVARVQSWTESLRLGPGTDPRRGLEAAIRMKPDAIFLLSDGQFLEHRGPNTEEIVDRHVNAGTIVPINTISFELEDTIPKMKRIAKISNGKHRHTGIREYGRQIASLRGPMRVRAVQGMLAEDSSWDARERLINEHLLPMLHEEPIERLNAETLLNEATMGLFADQFDSVLKKESRAAEQWKQLLRQIDAFDSTQQVTTLNKTLGDRQRLLYEALELQNATQLFVMLDKLDLEELSVGTMISMLRVLSRYHDQYDTSAESIGWTRFLLARLDGKRVKAGPRPATTVWSADEAEEKIVELFADRQEQASLLYSRYADKDKSQRTRDRLAESITEKFPETGEAGLVREALNKTRVGNLPVSIRIPIRKKAPSESAAQAGASP